LFRVTEAWGDGGGLRVVEAAEGEVVSGLLASFSILQNHRYKDVSPAASRL
jgi:hypothetical protein